MLSPSIISIVFLFPQITPDIRGQSHQCRCMTEVGPTESNKKIGNTQDYGIKEEELFPPLKMDLYGMNMFYMI